MRHTVFGLLSCCAAAAWSAEGLTPMGAEQAGNADGTIPEWTGGLTPMQWPRDFHDGGRLLDPWPGDAPRLVITADNWRDYASKLSAGHVALFQRDHDYRMAVYPTRRSVAFPEEIEAATAANRARAALKGADAVTGASLGVPFPEPRSGAEVLWNHRLRYRGDAAEWRYRRAAVFEGRAPHLERALELRLAGYASLQPGKVSPAMHSYNLLRMEPAEELPDYTVLWHDAVDILATPRRIWGRTSAWKAYRAPPLGYDQVGIFSYRIRYFDMMDMFSGAFDRYVFKLVGKEERFVPYNSFRLANAGAEVLGPRHLAGDAARYELHRVWIVEATVRPGEGHPLRQRVFYVDEDSWSIVMADDYDAQGRLDRFQEGHLLPLYPIQAVDYAPAVTYDFPGKRYYVDRWLSDSPPPQLHPALRPSDFQPAVTGRAYRMN